MRATTFLLATFSVVIMTTVAQAQWITFTDKTAERLVLQPFADNLSGDPMADGMEKDIAVADLDMNGKLDAIVVRKRPFSDPGPRQDVLLISNKKGQLVDATAKFAPEFLTELTDARDVVVRDFTGDGWPDVVICNTFGQQPKFYRNRGRSFIGTGSRLPGWLGLKDESSIRFPTIETPADVSTRQFCAVWAGDIDGDESPDLYFSNYDPEDPTNDILFMNDGNGFFTNETDARLGNLANVSFGTSVEIHDIDNDGDNDIIKTTTLYDAPPFESGQYILFNNGNGTFTDSQQLNVDQSYMFTVGDLDGNGWLDQYIVQDFQDRVLMGQGVNGKGEVIYQANQLTNSPRTEGFGGNIKFKDIDGDGDLDLGVAPIDVDIANCGNNNGFCLLRNDGSGGLTDPYSGSTLNFNLSAHDYDYIDINNDGRLDLILCLCEGWRIFVQDPPAK